MKITRKFCSDSPPLVSHACSTFFGVRFFPFASDVSLPFPVSHVPNGELLTAS